MDVRANNILELIDLAAAAQEHRVRSHHLTPAAPIRVDRGSKTRSDSITDAEQHFALQGSDQAQPSATAESADETAEAELSAAERWEATTRHL